jgi:hypothetical protein
MARKNQIGYPTITGNVKQACWTHTGPASYTQVTNGTPATGGDIITAAELLAQGGLKYADWLTAPMCSDNGAYEASVIPIDGNSQASTGILPSRNFTLRWVAAGTSDEVAGTTNLSGRTIKLIGAGPQ